MMAFDDIYYIQRVREGNINAFAPIVNHYRKMVFSVVLKIIENREEAEDITQEIFIKVFKALDKFKAESEFSTWLYRIAYNTCLSEIRRKRLVFTSFDDYILKDEDVREDTDDWDTTDKLKYLDQALKTLPPEDSLLITLYYLNEMTIEQASTIAGISPANVKVKLYRIRKKLMVEIDRLMAIENGEKLKT